MLANDGAISLESSWHEGYMHCFFSTGATDVIHWECDLVGESVLLLFGVQCICNCWSQVLIYSEFFSHSPHAM